MPIWDTSPDSGFVYFVQAGICGPIKIGRAIDVALRIRAINVNSPVPVRLLGVIPGQGQERELHERFAKWRYHGEWFMPSRPLMEFIKQKATLVPSLSRVTRPALRRVLRGSIEELEIARDQEASHVLPPVPRRRPKIWHRSDRDCWYACVHGRQYKLTTKGGTPEQAEAELARLLKALDFKFEAA